MKLTGLLFLILIATFPLSAQDNSNAAVQSKVAALEKLWNQAYKARDLTALDGLLDDGLIVVNDDGSVQTKAEFLANVKVSTPSDEQQVVPESLNVHVLGNVAIASGIFRAKGIENGKPYARRERFLDTWINKSGKWVCVAADATPITH